MLAKKYRISNKKDFERIYSIGQKVKGKYGMVIGLYEEGLENPKFGVVVSKKVGKAHERNKIKRRVRNIIQEALNKGLFVDKGLKITYIAFKTSSGFADLRREVLEQFKKLLEK